MRRLAGPILIFLISVCFCWQLVLTDQYTWLESSDLSYQVLPWLQFQAGEWRQGHIPLWDPYHWAGQPLIGQGQPGVANPLNWVLFAVPLKHGWIRQSALHWFYLLLHFLPALFLYLLCRDLQLGFLPAILGACVFGFAGFFAGVDWPQMLSGGVWLPLVILFLLRAARGEKQAASSAWSGVFLGLSWLSGHHQVPIFVTLAVAGLWIFFIFRTGRFDRTMAVCAVVSLGTMFLVSALQTLPAYEYGRISRRWAGVFEPLEWNQVVPYTVHSENSLKPLLLIGMVVPGFFGFSVFEGVLAVSLALLGLWAWKSRTAVQVGAAMTLAGIFLAIGNFTAMHGVIYSVVPFVEKARSPQMAIILANFGIAMLAAWGAEALLKSELPSGHRYLAYGLITFGILAFLIPAALYLTGAPVSSERVIISGLFAFAVAAMLLWNPSRPGKPVLAGIALLVCCELSLMFGALLPSRYETTRTTFLTPMSKFADIVDFLRTRPQPVRVDVDRNEVKFNFGDFYGVEELVGYLASLTNNTRVLEWGSPRVDQLLAVNYLLGKAPHNPNQPLVFTAANGLKLFANPGAFDRARIVHSLVPFKTESDLKSWNGNDKNDLRQSASMLGDPPQLESCTQSESAMLVKHSSGHEVILATAACRGMLVIAETNYPGWHATVDGFPARIYEPYGALRGIVLDKGSHRIELTYRPASVIWGAVCTLLGLLAAVALTAVERRRPAVKSTML